MTITNQTHVGRLGLSLTSVVIESIRVHPPTKVLVKDLDLDVHDSVDSHMVKVIVALDQV